MEGLRYHRDLGETEQAAQDESFYMQTFQTIDKVATDKEMERQIGLSEVNQEIYGTKVCQAIIWSNTTDWCEIKEIIQKYFKGKQF